MKKLAIAAAAVLALAGCSSGSSEPVASPSAGITVSNAYIMTSGDVAGMFGDVANSGTEAVMLTGGSAPDVGMVQIHETVKEGSKEIMQEVPGGLEVPAGGSVQLQPGGYHVMMMDVTADWQPGDTVPVTLDFSDGSAVVVQAPVKQREGQSSMENG